MRVAVIGIGSNSVRLLVADYANGELVPVMRERCGTRLFAGLKDGALMPQSIESACAAAREMERKAREAGAGSIHIFATSAVRDASNKDVFIDKISALTGLKLLVCTGKQEAELSYAGAARSGLCGMIDIGGGSTEITIGEGERVMAALSTQMGAVRFSALYPISSAEDFPQVVEAATELLIKNTQQLNGLPVPTEWIGVGGTFTTLGAMEKQLASYDRSLVDGLLLSHEVVENWGLRLSDMSVEERLKLPGLQPQRADIVTHGVAILKASMDYFDMDTIRISDKGNLDGFLKKTLAKGLTNGR